MRIDDKILGYSTSIWKKKSFVTIDKSWKVRTQDPENFDEEVKSLGTAR